MTSDSGRGGSSGIRRRDRDARSARSYTCILSRKLRPAQRGRNCEKSLTETAALVTYCVFLLPPAGSLRRSKEDESIGQLSFYIGYRSGAIVWYRTTHYMIAEVNLCCEKSINLERAKKDAEKAKYAHYASMR